MACDKRPQWAQKAAVGGLNAPHCAHSQVWRGRHPPPAGAACPDEATALSPGGGPLSGESTGAWGVGEVPAAGWFRPRRNIRIAVYP